MLGGGEVFKEYSPNRPLELAAVANEKYTEAFDMHKLGDTTIAEDCQVFLSWFWCWFCSSYQDSISLQSLAAPYALAGSYSKEFACFWFVFLVSNSMMS